MSDRRIKQIVAAQEVSEGAGVNVFRTIGTPALRNLDPFLMLDQFSTDNPDDYLAGFPDHPHRGFSTFTYMLDGHMQHRDSMGNEGDLGPGGAQWMKAASGVIHSEMPQQLNGRMRGFQLWVNLPSAQKMTAPAYQNVRPESVPVIQDGGSTIRLLAGHWQERIGPVSDPHTGLGFMDISLQADTELQHALPAGDSAFVFLFEGQAEIAGKGLDTPQLAVLGAGDNITVSAGPQGARYLLVNGRPLDETVVQYGPFVMNTRAEIEQAFADYRDGRLVRATAAVTDAIENPLHDKASGQQ